MPKPTVWMCSVAIYSIVEQMMFKYNGLQSEQTFDSLQAPIYVLSLKLVHKQ